MPLLFIVMTILKLTGEHKIFYLQDRVGLNGKSFKLVKFATMLENSAEFGTVTVSGDPRILPFGALLRKSKLNELPQLWNILIGDMSLIGPRPLTSEAFDLYHNNLMLIIKSVKPGLSGVGSIAFRNEEEILSGQDNPMDFYKSQIVPFKGELEAWFVKNQSICLYLKLIFLTLLVVFMPKKKIPWGFINLEPNPPLALKKYF
jgi:lipopolysaccharide/colanic/teichoic acid biosynthesis glycosyltransferase